MARKRQQPLATFQTREQPVRVYAPTPSCRYYSVTWYEPGHERQQRTTVGKEKATAVEWARRKSEQLSVLQRSPHPLRPYAAVQELVDAFVDTANHPGWSKRTASKWQHLAARWLDADLRSKRCIDLHVEDFQRILGAAADKGLAESTIAGIRAMLSGIVRFGRSRSYLIDGQNPMDGLETPVDHNQAKPDGVDLDSIPSADDVKRLVAAIDDPVFKLMVKLAAENGMRFGELAALTADRVNTRSRIITVDRKLAEDTDSTQWVEAPKSRSTRTTFYSASLAREMRSRVKAAEKDAKGGGLGLLFPSPKGKYLRRPNFVKRVWKPAHRAAQWDARWTFHFLRHHAARALIETVGEFDAAQNLGHRNTVTTRRIYAGVFKGAAARAAKAFGRKGTRQ